MVALLEELCVSVYKMGAGFSAYYYTQAGGNMRSMANDRGRGAHHQSNSGDGVGLLRLFIASTLNLVLRFFESRMNERLRNSTH